MFLPKEKTHDEIDVINVLDPPAKRSSKFHSDECQLFSQLLMQQIKLFNKSKTIFHSLLQYYLEKEVVDTAGQCIDILNESFVLELKQKFLH